ncbi:4-hydroxy-tetrahydrodipicolinate reductase [Portibacter lacus]|uniref:4-hydroxy-tetrahydrodipicolinate reductase n=1 Tax=Portibacter lacus TaxID=1099794 RepID=A0AA37SMG4_9BACT|nr:4-hydroxy-tetrahydrodipicolinate reductase [Portibacter lacus]GLR16502.1 4-hydroxy-tetrahydrodipicolinate reductase [Portibacter lacus]
MKLALIGYGKMGKTIHEIAKENGDEISFIIDKENAEDLKKITAGNTDVAIEFSNPESAFSNLSYCINNRIPVVSGTTGWLNKYDEVKQLCEEKVSAFMYASNFSIGVNVFFEVNKFLAEKMKKYNDYKLYMEEIHHTEKLDAPSGTAITLAEGIIEKNDRFQVVESMDIVSKRIGKTPGTHIIKYESEVDSIEIKHEANSRLGFAKGAYEAAKWLKDKKGVYSIQDMLFGE